MSPSGSALNSLKIVGPHAGVVQQRFGPLRVAGRDDVGVAHEQRPGHAELARELAQPLEASGAEDESGSTLPVNHGRPGARGLIVDRDPETCTPELILESRGDESNQQCGRSPSPPPA